ASHIGRKCPRLAAVCLVLDLGWLCLVESAFAGNVDYRVGLVVELAGDSRQRRLYADYVRSVGRRRSHQFGGKHRNGHTRLWLEGYSAPALGNTPLVPVGYFRHSTAVSNTKYIQYRRWVHCF